jgi:hypothetical protein
MKITLLPEKNRLRHCLLTLCLVGLMLWLWLPRLLMPVDISGNPKHDDEAAPINNAMRDHLVRYVCKDKELFSKECFQALILIQPRQLALMEVWLQKNPLEQLRELTVQESIMLRADAPNAPFWRTTLLRAWLAQNHLPFNSQPANTILAAGDRLPQELKFHALQTLAKQAYVHRQLSVALDIQQLLSLQPETTWGMIQHAMDVAAEAERPQISLNMLSAWLDKHAEKLPTAQLTQALDHEMHLMQQIGQGQEAFDRELRQLKTTTADHRLCDHVLDRALTAARFIKSSQQMLPWLERQLETYPEDALDPEQLLLQPGEISPDYIHWLSEYAPLIDQYLPAQQSLPTCMKLAALGRPSAFYRFLKLAKEARKEAEVEDFRRLVISKYPELRQPYVVIK